MESPNSLYSTNTINNNTTTTTVKDGSSGGGGGGGSSVSGGGGGSNGGGNNIVGGFDSATLGSNGSDNLVIPSNFLISTKEIIARFPHNKRVGHYLLGRKLGEGSFAKVKEGLQTLTGQKVAIKVIDKKKAKEDAYVSKNMRREGKLLQMIIHPNIIQLYELMETENSYYLVTELCEGGDLMDYICARKYLTEACTRKFIRQIISAVDYLHRIGILHRDLKIENLLLDKNLNIKLIDFGLSNYTKSELCITQCGSPAYAAPELLAHKKYGCKVDVWSIGVNMYAMLTGNLPFTVEPFNIKSLYNKMMKNEMNAIPEHLSKSGEDLLRKLLNPDPVKRISLKEAMEHQWVNEGYASQLKPYPYPNKPSEDQINPTILRYMNTNMEFNVTEVSENIKSNKPSSALATYYLLLNKVKTMLMKIEPKKTRTDNTKQLTKDIKTSRPTTNTPTIATTTNTTNTTTASPGGGGGVINQSQMPPPPLPTTANTTTNNNAQSPLSRTIKAPVATSTSTNPNSNSNTVTSNGYNVIKSAQNNKDLIGANKLTERTSSPMTTVVSSQQQSSAHHHHHPISSAGQQPNAPTPTNLNGNNTVTAASAFAGAIKTLTQKYKTMHLTSPLDTTTAVSNNNNNINNNNNNSNIVTNITTNNISPPSSPEQIQASTTATSPITTNTNTNNTTNSANSSNFHYKTAYIHHHHHHLPSAPQQQQPLHSMNLNTSLDQTFNNISIIGEQTTPTTNSDNLVGLSLDEAAAKHHQMTKAATVTGTLNLTRNTPTPAKMSNNSGGSTAAEWTQLIKLPVTNGTNNAVPTSALKTHKSSDLNNNDLSMNNTSSTSNSTNGNTTNTTNVSTSSPTFHMPMLNSTGAAYNNSNNSTNSTLNSTLMSNRSSKSPIVKKLSSPLTLPSIDAAGRSTPQ